MKTEKIITRTIITNKVTVVGLDNDDNPVVKVMTAPDLDGKALTRWIYDNAVDFTPAKVKSVEKIETLYGISESDFIKYGHILPPRKDYTNKG